ncbi:NAD(P)-binding domain protein [Cordyceps fumosorosea ARSEF 2679]|uniref:NAD(P)-binding domain protein n=1 Tax=Cordyceps fumosorosea (strain ARSEF 2679) TaxID=1081104 RepID=A0A168D9F8_CORFA|nr:NAD(P)-binding domain protein [Cordyceps fumosorosea ARSEF 2679]OAA72323.1 NAD(P)-binding domain protein [Cordyceps fumosorosea ARSEF 2679]
MPDSLSLQNKVAIVTGSGRENGIGAGIALALARNGASVVVHYVSDSVEHRASQVCETLREAGGQAIAVQAALDTIEGAHHLVSKTLEGLDTNHIDILVNNAGIAYFSAITEDLEVKQLADVFHVNVLGPFYMVHAVLPHMPRGGRIINISSTNSKRGNVNVSTYAASKAALDSLTWTWAGELGRTRGITVNSIAPGPVLTDLYPKGHEQALMETEIALTRAEDRAGTPADIGDAVLLLVNERARWITGQYISLFLEAEFHRGMHACIHFIYNSKDASCRPRDTNLGIEASLDDYPLPLMRKDAAERLIIVVRRLLQQANPHAALSIYTVLIGWYTLDEVNSGELLAEILDHGSVPDSLLAARVYIENAKAVARRETFEVARILISEAKSAVAHLGERSARADELRLLDAQMAFIALGGLDALSGPLASAVIEGEYAAMVRDFTLTAHYNLAARAVTEYMACTDYIRRPTRVDEILALSDALGAASGNAAYMWTTRLIALGSAPLQGQVALGRQGVWCQAYLERYAEAGAWEVARRYALYYSMYYHKVGDWTRQLQWSVAAQELDAKITNDPRTRLSGMYQIFTVMIQRLQNLPAPDDDEEEEEEDDELEMVQQYGIDGFEACEEAGFKELAHSFLDKLSHVGIVPEALLVTSSQESAALAVAPLGEPKNMDADELLALYMKQRDLLDRLLGYDCVDQAFELHDQLTAHLEPIFEVLRHGTDLKLRAGDYAAVQNAMDVRLSKGVLRADAARGTNHDYRERALAIVQAAAARSGETGQLETRREALLVAAQWAFRMKEPGWGRVVVDLLRQADDCMDASRRHVTAASRLDALDQKQHLVASYGRSDVYVFGYMVMTALKDTGSESLALMSPEDSVSAEDVWTWMQRGKGRSIMDMLEAAEEPAPPAADTSSPDDKAPPSDKAPLAAEFDIGISLHDVQSMASDYAMSKTPDTGSSMIMADWFLTSSHIDMVVVDAAGQVHVETLDFTLENAMKSLLRQPFRLRGAADVKSWREAYLGRPEFLGELLTAEALAELDWLVEPLAHHSKPGDLLVLCPSGALHGLPLHALPVDGRPLVERNPIIYTTSLSLLFRCYQSASRREATAPPTAAVFGVYGKAGRENDAGSGGKSDEERRVEETLESVSGLLRTEVDYDVSPDAFVDRCRDRHLIHYHGHAVLGKARSKHDARFGQSLLLAGHRRRSSSPSPPESDALLQWDDSIDDALLLSGSDTPGGPPRAARLSARDMMTRLTLPAAHVTLIACSSASQDFSAGDEPQGLIPVLMLCGATSVLGTLWPILSADGRAFSECFYAAAFGSEKMRPGEVVNLARAVQRSVLAMRARRPEPIHWAGFVLHGAWFHKC